MLKDSFNFLDQMSSWTDVNRAEVIVPKKTVNCTLSCRDDPGLSILDGRLVFPRLTHIIVI